MTPRNYRQEAEREVRSTDGSKRWVKARIEAIHERVTAHDVLRRHGVPLKYGDDHEEQFSCPFHGTDTKPSARVYPSSLRGPSHAWCFVCQERWDVMALWKKFNGFEGRFTLLLARIEQEYGITPPEAPPTDDYEDTDDPEVAELISLFEICERRLKLAKPAFEMQGFLTVGSVLDRLYDSVENHGITFTQAKEQLQKVLDKIGEKVRSCPGG